LSNKTCGKSLAILSKKIKSKSDDTWQSCMLVLDFGLGFCLGHKNCS
jgi:hypothetical protein